MGASGEYACSWSFRVSVIAAFPNSTVPLMSITAVLQDNFIDTTLITDYEERRRNVASLIPPMPVRVLAEVDRTK